MKKKFQLKKIQVMGPFVVSMIMLTMPAYAATTPKILTGTTSLASAALSWCMALIPIVAALALGWCKVQKMLSGNDPAVVAKQNTWMKNILISAVIGETASALITSIVSFYK